MVYLLIFLLEVTFLAYSEKKRWNSLLTPLNMMMLTNALAVIVAIVYSYSNQYVPNFYLPSLIVWIVGLALFSIPSFYFSSLCQNDGFNVVIGPKNDSYKLLNIIATICILISFVKIRSLSGNLDKFGTDEFSDEYQVKGVFAHLSVVLCAIFAYSVYKFDRQHIYSIFIILGALVGMYAIGTKSWIIAPLLIGYYARLMTGKTAFNVKTIVLPIILIFGIFFLSYFLIMVMASTSEMSITFMQFIFEHFIDYFSGANLAFSLDYQKGIIEPEMSDALIAPFANILNALSNEPYINPINPVYWDIGDLGMNNVRTVFGTFLCYSHSYFVFVLMTLIYSIITYAIYIKSRHSNSLFLLLANCTCLAFLTFSFFDFTWINLTPYEVLFIFFILHIFLSNKQKNALIYNPQ